MKFALKVMVVFAGVFFTQFRSQAEIPIAIAFSGSANGTLQSCHCPSSPWGGLAKRGWLLNNLCRQMGEQALIYLDSGDLFPVDGNFDRSVLMLEIYKVMQPDAVALGDQELRGGIDLWQRINQAAGINISDSFSHSFPWLSGGYRVFNQQGIPNLLAAPWIILEHTNYKIGIVSIVGKTAWQFVAEMPAQLEITEPEYVLSLFQEATSNQLDLAIILSHQGLDADRALAQRVQGFDLIIGGHSQSLLNPPEIVNDIAICQAGKNGENLGLLMLCPTTAPHTNNNNLIVSEIETEPQTETADTDPFELTTVKTLRWQIAQKIVPLTTEIDDDPLIAALVEKSFVQSDRTRAARLTNPDPAHQTNTPALTLSLPLEPVVLQFGETREIRVPIINQGDVPLNIARVRSRSPWLEVASYPAALTPGTVSNVVFTVNATQIDRFFRCDFTIITDDPQRRVVQASFSGTVSGDQPVSFDIGALCNQLKSTLDLPLIPATLAVAVQPAIQLLPEAAPPKVIVDFFHAPGCRECKEVAEKILPAYSQMFAGTVEIHHHDITISTNYLKLVRLQEELDVRSNEPVVLYLNRQYALPGLTKIRNELERKTREILQTESAITNSTTVVTSSSLPHIEPPAQEKKTTAENSEPVVSVSTDVLQPDNALPQQVQGADVTTMAEEQKVTADQQEELPQSEDVELLQSRLQAFTMPAILLAGLIDGINPCAFAAIVFFITLLSVSGVKSTRLLLVGAGYTLAVFCTYLLLGFGVFKLLHSLTLWHWLSETLRWLMTGMLIVLAILSVRDAIRFKQSGKAGDVTLQLSDKLKQRMHQTMRKHLNPANLFISSLIIGVLVTLIEAVCTGQVYLPTLVMMSRYAATRVCAFSLLLLYNLMFVMPLIVVIIAAFIGTRNQRLLTWSKKNVIWGKILMALFFAGLALLLTLF